MQTCNRCLILKGITKKGIPGGISDAKDPAIPVAGEQKSIWRLADVIDDKQNSKAHVPCQQLTIIQAMSKPQ